MPVGHSGDLDESFIACPEAPSRAELNRRHVVAGALAGIAAIGGGSLAQIQDGMIVCDQNCVRFYAIDWLENFH